MKRCKCDGLTLWWRTPARNTFVRPSLRIKLGKYIKLINLEKPLELLVCVVSVPRLSLSVHSQRVFAGVQRRNSTEVRNETMYMCATKMIRAGERVISWILRGVCRFEYICLMAFKSVQIKAMGEDAVDEKKIILLGFRLFFLFFFFSFRFFWTNERV